MDYLSDLHLHSKYSRAVSPSMNLDIMAKFAREKGLNLLSISDFTHPVWLKEVKAKLKETHEGIYELSDEIDFPKPVYFLFSTEIASIYKQGGKLRRIHNLIFAPNLETVEKINAELIRRGANLNADGRPIIGLSSKALLELILEIDKNCMLVPCHVWTPHFGVYGSKSGFDSLTECFEDLEKYVYGIETGISSDPEMNWRIKELQKRSILSFSDAHSPANMAREATAFTLSEIAYSNVKKAIERKGGAENRISYTVEFYPEEGKYHFSGHRNCGVTLSPSEIAQESNICPVCKRELTEGVAIRIDQLAGPNFYKDYEEKLSPLGIKWYTDLAKHHPPYVKLVRLIQIVAEGIGSTVASQKSIAIYTNLMQEFGVELDILLKTSLADISRVAGHKIAEGVGRVRKGEIEIRPGFDGEYGKVKIFSDETNANPPKENNISSQIGIDF